MIQLCKWHQATGYLKTTESIEQVLQTPNANLAIQSLWGAEQNLLQLHLSVYCLSRQHQTSSFHSEISDEKEQRGFQAKRTEPGPQLLYFLESIALKACPDRCVSFAQYKSGHRYHVSVTDFFNFMNHVIGTVHSVKLQRENMMILGRRVSFPREFAWYHEVGEGESDSQGIEKAGEDRDSAAWSKVSIVPKFWERIQ